MNPKVSNNNVTAYCDVCKANSNFLYKDSNGKIFGSFDSENSNLLDSRVDSRYGRIEYILVSCSSCKRGGLVELHYHGGGYSFISFFPSPTGHTDLPKKTPSDIQAEFKSSENCVSIDEYRPAAAMLRSTLEKTLKKHGYEEWGLSDNLKNLSSDNILPRWLVKQNSEIVKILGDEILHGDWREVTTEEYRKAHHYVERLIESFYDDHASVIEDLQQRGRLEAKKPSKKEKVEPSDIK